MKVLFAVNNDKISNAIVKKYKEQYGEDIEFKNVYYFNGLLTEIKKDKSYDRIVISEELELFLTNNYSEIDTFISEKLDAISDECDEIEIILICPDRRDKKDPLLNKFFAMGIYNILIGEDRSIEQLCKLIHDPRNKKEAKQYINFSGNYKDVESENDKVSELELKNILAHYKKLGSNYEKYSDSFSNIASQYNTKQMKVIINVLPPNVKEVLEQTSDKYKEINQLIIGIENAKTKPESSTENVKKEKNKKEKSIKSVNEKNMVLKNKGSKLKDNTENIDEDSEKNDDSDGKINVPSDDLSDSSKAITFVGAPKVGTTFLINLLADYYSIKGVKVAILDLTKNKNMYFIHTNNEEDLRRVTYECLNKLSAGVDKGLSVKENVTVYTTVPDSQDEIYNVSTMIETLKLSYQLVLIDADFYSPFDCFKYCDEIYAIQDMDILNIQYLTTFLRKLKHADINIENIKFIINKFVNCDLTSKKLLGAISTYNDPKMENIEKLIDKDEIDAQTIPFDLNVYRKYIKNSIECKIDLKKYSGSFIGKIKKIANTIYSVNSKSNKN